MKTERETDFEKLVDGVDMLAPLEYTVRYIALKMFLAQDDGVSYNNMTANNRLIKTFATEDEFNKAYNFVFSIEPLL